MAPSWQPDLTRHVACVPGAGSGLAQRAALALSRADARTCIGRNGEREDIDGPLPFFRSNASGYVTGQVLMVDGGGTAK